jgi:hypothetical protein
MYKLTDNHLNPTAWNAEKVNLALSGRRYTVAVTLNTLVATGKDHCTVCCELYSVVK